jgi:hypothetical protein
MLQVTYGAVFGFGCPFQEDIIFILATLAKQERIRLSERTKAGRPDVGHKACR